MKTSERRWIGAALIGAPFVGSTLLVLFHVFPETLESNQTFSSSSNTNIATASVYSVHFPLWFQAVFIVSIVLGLALLLSPRRKKSNA
jgi:hypothetical protein